MPEIQHQSLKRFLEEGHRPPVFLLHGEEVICKHALNLIVDALLPGPLRSCNYAAIEGADENVYAAVEQLKTYSMFSDKKVVSFLDSGLFMTRKKDSGLLVKSVKAWEEKRFQTAARSLLLYLKQVQITLTDLNQEETLQKLEPIPEESMPVIQAIAGYCRENEMTAPADVDAVDIFFRSIEDGFPKDNFLVITTDHVDKRHRLYQLIQQKGCTVNCAVPRGERRADKMAQEEVLRLTAGEILSSANKSMDSEVFGRLVEITGFELRTFRQNLEKLVHYTGERRKILVGDVETVLERTRKDPVFELTKAVSMRDLESALFFLRSLMNAEMHPLQILAALSNQVRKLLAVKGFLNCAPSSLWHAKMSYPEFERQVMPVLAKYEADFAEMLTAWRGNLTDDGIEKGHKKTAAPKTDLFILKSPASAYPAYQLFKQTDHFSTTELANALKCLCAADVQMKQTAQSPRLILESVLMTICGYPS
jgi:DNA polymerase-3 subunit delta